MIFLKWNLSLSHYDIYSKRIIVQEGDCMESKDTLDKQESTSNKKQIAVVLEVFRMFDQSRKDQYIQDLKMYIQSTQPFYKTR